MESKDTNFNLDFDLSPKEIVASLLDEIEYHRGEGRTLPAIYSALSKREGFSIKFGCFKTQYYRQRKKDDHITREDPVLENRQREVAVHSIDSKQVEDRNSNSEEKTETETISSDKSTDMTLEARIAEHQRIAATEFFK